MENFLIGAYRLLKALPEGGAAIAYLNAENESLKKTISRLKQCVHYMEKRFKDHVKQSAERGYNAARVVKCFNNRSIQQCADKCNAIYHEYDLKVKEIEKSLEKQYNENLESYERLLRSLESDKRRLELQNLKLRVDVENFKTAVKTAEFQSNQLLEEIEKFKVNKETVELENKKLSEEIENHKINKKYEINAIIKEKIDSERLKWEQLKNEEVMEAKRADWCNVCLKSAVIHCCWNTNYCSNQCRQKHYEKHSRHCLNEESKKAPSASTASAEKRKNFTQRSNIQRSVTLMSSSSHHTSVMQATEFTFATNSVTVPHEPTSSFMQGRNASPLLPTPKKSCSKTLGASRRKERKER
ncbi:structural maintenance of chromosomes protein 4-like [Stegodyphus dumicola]|uniref:structural maintenance of chromosomes protein 4-like n=1 Tax=Stegodyphus dumicola TaxID=202533 RepID=UPI0015B03137|nr:structural maintenance of chromosomes protein 4-like [Stegodyphus dumicola]